MKKQFINAALLALALISVAPTLQSCKDYDDDITTINGVNADQAQQLLDLKKQIEDLSQAQKNAQSAADKANSAAEAARKLAEEALAAGNQAEADALAAQAMAADAKAAAEQAKADALAKIAEEAAALQAKIEDNAAAIASNTNGINQNAAQIAAAIASIAQNADAIAALDGKITAVDAKLANYSTTQEMVAAINQAISENNAAINSTIDAAKAELLAQINAVAARTSAVELQQATLAGYVDALQSNYQALSNTVDGLSATIQNQQQAIADIQSDLAQVKGQLAELTSSLATMQADVNSVKETVAALDADLKALSTRVGTVENELNTLCTLLLPGRLSSVTLVPNLYIGGIPTIEFMTIQYNEWAPVAGKQGLYDVTAQASEITSNDAVAHYRLNPSTVVAEDIKIDELSYVSSRAVSRSESALTVNRAEIEDGILNVWVKNNNAGKLSDDSKNEITIAALNVPIADQHLFESEKTTGASVYSEYSRVAESYITPTIKAIPSSEVEGYDLTQWDLTEFATNDDIDNALNEKDFIALDVVYNSEGQDLLDIVEGQYGSPSIVVGKEELTAWGLDFEFVLFGKTLSPDVVYAKMNGTTIQATNPSGKKLSDAIGKTPWIAILMKDVANNKIIDVQYVQVKFVQDTRPVDVDYEIATNLFCGDKEFPISWAWMKDNVLSRLNATNSMTAQEFVDIYTDITINATNPLGDDVSANLVATYDPATNAFVWTISAAEFDMSEIADQVFKGTIVCNDPNELFPTVTVNVEITVEVSDADLPTLNKGQIYWADGMQDLQYILAYPMNPVNAGSGQVAEYNTNILQGRVAPYFTGALDCALWGTYINDTKKYTDDYVWFTTEYSDPNTFVNGELPIAKADLQGLSLNFWIENNEKGIAMVENEERVLIDWRANLVGNDNAELAPTFGKCWVYIQQPLKFNRTKVLSITDNVGSTVTVDLSNSWKVTDYYNNTVVDPNNTYFEEFYGLEPIQFKVEDAYLTKTEATAAPGSTNYIGTCADYSVTVGIDGNTLVYTNMGAIVQQTTYLQIPVELPHRWGVLKGTLTVKLNKFAN